MGDGANAKKLRQYNSLSPKLRHILALAQEYSRDNRLAHEIRDGAIALVVVAIAQSYTHTTLKKLTSLAVVHHSEPCAL